MESKGENKSKSVAKKRMEHEHWKESKGNKNFNMRKILENSNLKIKNFLKFKINKIRKFEKDNFKILENFWEFENFLRIYMLRIKKYIYLFYFLFYLLFI